MPQYSFLLPKNLAAFISSKSSNQQQADSITQRLESLITDGEKSLKKKAQGSQFFYTFNIDIGKHAHRAIFEQVSFNGHSFFLLRGIAWMHNYGAALRWKALNQVNEAVLNELYATYEGYQIVYSSSALQIQDDDLVEDNRAIYYRGRSLIPTSLQAKILYPQSSEPLSMPVILVGPPGSGKTLIGMGLLQERAMEHCNNEDPNVLELCYVAESSALVKQQKENWADFAAHCLSKHVNEFVKVHFYTVQEYAQRYAKSQEYAFLGDDDARKLLEHHLGKDVKAHQELYHNAWRIYLDCKNNKSFNESLYKETGASNSFYSLEEREQCYVKYIKFMSKLEQSKEFLCGISPMPARDTKHQNKFHLTIIDEAQRIHPALLQGFLSETQEHNALLIGDPYQKGGSPFSSLDALRALTRHCFKLELSSSQLPSSLRVQHDVAGVLDRVVLLYTHLLGGKVDAISYSSLQHEESVAQDKAGLVNVHLLPPASQTQVKALGANAHAAALVLNPEDKAQARELINGANVFTAKEVLGLEFSQILLYLSENTLKQFINISRLMNDKNIKPGQALLALNNKPAEKGSNKGPIQELLSDLLVALSRTQGALYVICESLSSNDDHKLTTFLDWFKACLGQEQADVQIEEAHNSDEDWLHAINNFIQANALIQANDNLQTKFKLTKAQADAYVALCQQNKMISTAAELQHWLSPTQLPEDSLVEPATLLVESSNTDFENWEDLHVRLLHEGSSAIESFLTRPQALELLFKVPMNNTHCLWVHITLNHFDTLNALFAKSHHPYETLLKEGGQYAKTTQNYLLLLCLSLVTRKHAPVAEAKQYLCNVLLQSNQELQNQLIGLLLKNNYLDSLTQNDFFNIKAVEGSPQLAHILLNYHTGNLCEKYKGFKLAIVSAINSGNGGYVSSPGVYQGHNLITLLLNSESSSILFKDKTPELLVKKWANLFGKACPGALHRLSQQEKYIELLNKLSVKSNEKFFVTFLSPLDNDLSAFYLLCESDSGMAFLNKNQADFTKALKTSKVLFEPITEEGANKGATIFYRLCCSAEGVALLKSFLPDFIPQLKDNPKWLFSPVGDRTTTAFLQLCGHVEGRTLLKNYWSYFASHLRSHPEILFAPINSDSTLIEDTAFYRLFCTIEGKALPGEHLLDVVPCLSTYPDLLFAPITGDHPYRGGSVFFQLCSDAAGRALLKKYWLDFASHLRSHPDLLFSPVTCDHTHEVETPFIQLCSADSIALLKEHWSDFASHLRSHPDLLFVPIISEGWNQGVTPFFQLCFYPEGKALLMEHWSDFASHLSSHPELLFAPLIGDGKFKGFTPFYLLCRSTEGLVLLKEHWSDFASHLSNHPALLFAPVTAEGPYKGETAFSRLCVSSISIELLHEHWSDFASHLRNHPALLFAPVTGEGPYKGETAFHLLCNSAESIAFLKAHWSDFSSYLCSNPHLLFDSVTVCDGGNGATPVIDLSRCEEGKALLELFLTKIGESNKTILLEFINKLLINQSITEKDKKGLKELQQRTKQQPNASRFFTSSQIGNDDASGDVEKKPSDVGYR